MKINKLVNPARLCSLIISLLLHLFLLSQLNWRESPIHAIDQKRVEVRIIPPYDFKPLVPIVEKAHRSFQDGNSVTFKEKTSVNNREAKVVSKDIIQPLAPHEDVKKDNNQHLDITQLVEQVKNNYLEHDRASGEVSAPLLTGDYYGTYNGNSDTGTFFVHVDGQRHASGSGQSTQHGFTFNISGSVTMDGFIEMSGSGIAGNARFQGRLDKKTGKVDGVWTAGIAGGGTFSGQHE